MPQKQIKFISHVGHNKISTHHLRDKVMFSPSLNKLHVTKYSGDAVKITMPAVNHNRNVVSVH